MLLRQPFKIRRKIVFWSALALIFFSCTIGIAAQSSSTHLAIWVAPSLERIPIRAKPSSDTSIELYAARGEYESFQIGIKAPQISLTNVNVTISDLFGSNGQVISKSNITLYREHYVRVNHPSPKQWTRIDSLLQSKWYADGLIPFVDPETKTDITGSKLDAVPFNLSAGENQSIWVDVFVPRDVQPGEYKGTFTVTSDGETATGEIRLKVWNFELPLKPSLGSAYLFWEENRKSAFVELLKHRLMPVGDINPADERELIDRWGLSSIRLPFWSGANYLTCNMEAPPSVEQIKAKALQHQQDLFLYVYPVDEIDDCPNLYEPLKQWAQNLHEAGVSNLVVMTPVPELYKSDSQTKASPVDIWVVQAKMYERAKNRVAEVLKEKGKVWFYTTLVQDSYSPKWLIDFQPIQFRIPHGFINQSLGLTGVLYWRVDLWTEDPWNNIQTYTENSDYFPGEGMLFYPGEQVGIQGVVPSIRLKWMRDGVEDYEYIQILKNLGHKDWALYMSHEVGRNWKSWTKDPQFLESTRKQLGEKIEKILAQ